MVTIEVYGDVGAEEARQLHDLAALAVADRQAVVIDLERVDSLTVDAAKSLLFTTGSRTSRREGVTVRTGAPARTAVLQAYARHRVGQAQS